MAVVKFPSGVQSLTMQPDRTIVLNHDGLLEGQVAYEIETSIADTLPVIGSDHPDNFKLKAWKTTTTRMTLGRTRIVVDYIGINSDPTPKIVSFPGGSGRDPIETHPDFVKFAGSAGAPKNGAIFDTETGEFLGFSATTTSAAGSTKKNDFGGVNSYIVPNVLVYLTYYTWRIPTIGRLGRIKSGGLTGVHRPSNVKNWLLIGKPYEQVGPLYRVTEQYLGSGPDGWNRDIYA